ncbi:MAG: leucyl/phenylalanyl-tRNA--protein transferase [Spirochaetales bacterium]|nr:leucyl/phenylalanyl-tRNA--protein transferase [Spirochaetales bacterium]MCF7937054.1 leucyl/phenylalanyl-tRNA--protein transferase [Spirochaetales bacterium]
MTDLDPRDRKLIRNRPPGTVLLQTSPFGIIVGGGDLEPETLLRAYRYGFFPWYDQPPILWHHPNERFILPPSQLHVPKRIRRNLRKQPFRLTMDQDFPAVISACSSIPREDQNGTWITSEMQDAYTRLHRLGYAHSVEAWDDEGLAGGLYGVSLGRCFFGESMFTYRSDASKAAFAHFASYLDLRGFVCIDAQVYTEHLARFGAYEIPRLEYLDILRQGCRARTWRGRWSEIFSDFPGAVQDLYLE